MCEICHKNPCDPRCPNHVEVPVFLCSGCGKNILEGEDYYDILGEQYCEKCVERMRYIAEFQSDL